MNRFDSVISEETLAEIEMTDHFDSNYSEWPDIPIHESVPCKFLVSIN